MFDVVGQAQVDHSIAIKLKIGLHLWAEEVLEARHVEQWIAELPAGHFHELVGRHRPLIHLVPMNLFLHDFHISRAIDVLGTWLVLLILMIIMIMVLGVVTKRAIVWVTGEVGIARKVVRTARVARRAWHRILTRVIVVL